MEGTGTGTTPTIMFDIFILQPPFRHNTTMFVQILIGSPRRNFRLPSVFIALGITSFLTDMSSEMIYPLLPVFLTTVLGAGAVSLGIIEGIAETTASFLKLLSGIWSDRATRRKPFVLFGYGLAGLARPLIGIASGWGFVLVMRFTDRIGKGLRTAPRDALIVDAVPITHRGTAFGFQRALDHAGAVTGPVLAAILLMVGGVSVRHVFLLAFLPAIAVLFVLTFGVREVPKEPPKTGKQPILGHWRELGSSIHLYLLALLVFTLGNSTDAFILLHLNNAGMPLYGVSLVWAAHHVIKMISSWYGGALSDRMGRKRIVLTGWTLYSVVYLAFALSAELVPLIIIFLVYGIYYGLTEPVERAWIADMAPRQQVGAALGFYHAAIGLGALPASVLFGWVWNLFGAPIAFIMGATLAFTASLLLSFVGKSEKDAHISL
ncbi:MAG: drug efflux system protein MdtG [Candidatus Hydrogenedentes bacterium ADurb.Bin179]|nr:MAG: drug efflux system protein MdtG [Candidatus Hydrogenedentes bacterium ADurb.Bin179]